MDERREYDTYRKRTLDEAAELEASFEEGRRRRAAAREERRRQEQQRNPLARLRSQLPHVGRGEKEGSRHARGGQGPQHGNGTGPERHRGRGAQHGRHENAVPQSKGSFLRGQQTEGLSLAGLPLDLAQVSLPIAILWMEIVFKIACGGSLFPQLFFLALFSLAAGEIIYLLSSLAPIPLVNRIVRLVLLAGTGVIFVVEYFVFRSFKMHYDLITVLSGAGGIAGGFGAQTLGVVLSPAGLLMEALFLAPAIVYLVVRWPWKGSEYLEVGGLRLPRHLGEPASPPLIVTGLGAAVAAHLLALVLVFVSGNYGRAYTDRYSYPGCVENFGLLTSLRKEVGALVFGGGRGASFSAEEPSSLTATVARRVASQLDSATNHQASMKPGVSYGKNVLDIDFAANAQSAGDEVWGSLDEYVAAQVPSSKNEMTGRFAGYNLVFVSCEALSAEAIRPDTTPTLYRMATKGIQFTDYYQPASAGTTGGEYENIFGMLPTDGGASVKDTAGHNNYLSMGWALNALGYDGWAFHNNDYNFYDRDITHNQLGYNHGYMGLYNGMERWVEPQWPESDLEMVKGTFDDLYGGIEPFNVYYMSVSGHGTYDFYANAMSIKWEDEVAAIKGSDPVRAYLACNIDLDRAMEYLIGQLEERGMADHTVIVLAADHFPYGLDEEGSLGNFPYLSELYGYNVETSFQRDHNRLVIWSGSLEKEVPYVIDTPTSSLDILPTLMNLFGIEWDSRLLPGRDVFSDRSPLVFDLLYNWKTDQGTYTAAYDHFEPAEGAKVADDYVQSINAAVANKINYCTAVLESDYLRHVFGDPQDVEEMNAAGKKAHPDILAKNRHDDLDPAAAVEAGLAEATEVLGQSRGAAAAGTLSTGTEPDAA